MSDLTIRALRGWEILDSRGHPTLAVEAELSNGVVATAHVPAGKSTGRHEAVELRDQDSARYGGRGVRLAARHVSEVIAPAVAGHAAADQAGVDRRMIALDGTANKGTLGANAILGVSCAVARAVSNARHIPLWQYLGAGRRPVLPVPMVNILSGGLHAGSRIEFQDFLVLPHGFDTFAEALEAVVSIHNAARLRIEKSGYALTGVADEGGWGPALESNERALELLAGAIDDAGYEAGSQVSIAIDVAASHFFDQGAYDLASEGRGLSTDEMIELLAGWCARYPILSIEDALEEDDWAGWTQLTARLGGRVQLLGDDLFTTNPVRVRLGIAHGAANAVLVKMNQIGTLTETFEVLDTARAAGMRAVVSARSGETEDSFLADLAVASGAGQIKVGSVTRSERLAKYNRLLEIEGRGGVAYDRSLWSRLG